MKKSEFGVGKASAFDSLLSHGQTLLERFPGWCTRGGLPAFRRLSVRREKGSLHDERTAGEKPAARLNDLVH
jgi:hypothetical protein